MSDPASDEGPLAPDWGLREFQQLIETIYGARDAARGEARTFLWLAEEVGELARSLNTGTAGSLEERQEFADVLAWLTTLASLRGIDLSDAARDKYGEGCPRCRQTPCDCSHRADQPPAP